MRYASLSFWSHCEVRAVLRRSNRVYKTTSEEPYKEAVLVYLKPVLSYKIPAPTALVHETDHSPFRRLDLHTKYDFFPILHSFLLVISRSGETMKMVANCVIPIPARQSTFYMELKLESIKYARFHS
jgi:hypothetical protein